MKLYCCFKHVAECFVFSIIQIFHLNYDTELATNSSSGHSFLCTISVSYSYITCVHIISSHILLLVICICSIGLSTSDSCSKWPHQMCYPPTAEWRLCTSERFRGQKLPLPCHSKSPRVWKLHATCMIIDYSLILIPGSSVDISDICNLPSIMLHWPPNRQTAFLFE